MDNKINNEKIFNYFNENTGIVKALLISGIIVKFKLTKDSAEKYYIAWKKEYMKPTQITTGRQING